MPKNNSLWWLNPSIEWSKIGQDNIHRPTETLAFQNIANEAKAINNYGLLKKDLLLTKTEYYIYKLDILVNKETFDTKAYGVYKKDSSIRKISKVSNYSEPFVLKKLNDISNKIRQAEKIGFNNLNEMLYISKNNSKRNRFKNKINNIKIVSS